MNPIDPTPDERAALERQAAAGAPPTTREGRCIACSAYHGSVTLEFLCLRATVVAQRARLANDSARSTLEQIGALVDASETPPPALPPSRISLFDRVVDLVRAYRVGERRGR